jgi:hypothetical protein
VRYAADTGAGQIQRLDPLGRPDATWRGPKGTGPARLTAGPWREGRPVVVALMTDGSLTMRDAHDGTLLARWLPTRPDGTAFQASDLAIRADATLYVADPERRAIHALRPDIAARKPPGAPPLTPSPDGASCALSGTKDAGPSSVVLGAAVAVTISLEAGCPSQGPLVGADVVLVITQDHRRDSIPAYAVRAARTLLTQVDDADHRFGAILVAGRDSPDTATTYRLASDPTPILAALRGPVKNDRRWYERIDEAVALLTATRRPDALPVIVAMLDPIAIDLTVAALARARDAGIVTYLITERAVPSLADAAGRPERYLASPSRLEVLALYRDLLRTAQLDQSGLLIIEDWLGRDLDVVPGSAKPTGLYGDGLLTWGSALMPSNGMTATYRVIPRRAGRVTIGDATIARYVDVDGSERAIPISAPSIEVVLPTPSPSPTPTTMPAPAPVLLPALDKGP